MLTELRKKPKKLPPLPQSCPPRPPPGWKPSSLTSVILSLRYTGEVSRDIKRWQIYITIDELTIVINIILCLRCPVSQSYILGRYKITSLSLSLISQQHIGSQLTNWSFEGWPDQVSWSQGCPSTVVTTGWDCNHLSQERLWQLLDSGQANQLALSFI